MAFLAAASQLAAAQGDGATQFSTASAVSSAASFASVLKSGVDRATGTVSSFAEEAQQRAGLLTSDHLGGSSSSSSAPQFPHDGKQCESCGIAFSMLKRRTMCSSCDRYLCAGCLTDQPLAKLTGITCFLCGSMCPRCLEQGKEFREFEACRSSMESGVSVTITLPAAQQQHSRIGMLFGGGGSGASQPGRNVHAWLSLGCVATAAAASAPPELRWASLERRGGRPVEEGSLVFGELMSVRNTGSALELSLKGQPEATVLLFNSDAERDAWSGYIELGIKVLTPDEARAALEAARSTQRASELEMRRMKNEERKKQLQDGLGGMRFTAEAMMARA
eukprot:TRINITY_DN48245_c0_g1_i1.p1 TRINITY_DN48245_c0_g1~~TRINITY_DN48245_c0_g1_i1.p1  ORF type:complete len:335 (-),score=85.96 TRINITY_DN48245_c0_g1_i1:155-1159(-)